MALLKWARYRVVILLSLLLHGVIVAMLWFSAPNWVSENIPEPTVINASILPPPNPVLDEVKPASAETTTPTSPAPKTSIDKKIKSSPIQSKVLNQPTESKKPTNNSNVKSVENNDNVQSTGSDVEDKGISKNDGATPADGAPSKAASTTKIKGVPIDVPIKDGGFKILYDLEAKYKGTEKPGEATFVFERTGATYRAVLSSKAAIAAFNATSEGEVRDNTVATTHFKDGRTISFLGVGKEKGGSYFIVDYPTHRITFKGKGADRTEEMNYDAVYDYLAAMIYVQAVLQSKQGQIGSLSLPIGKRKDIAKAEVIFGAREPRLSLPEGVFEAIPATINIPSGSIQSMKIWFVPKKQYRPLQIEIGFNSGQVLLRSRQSN